MNNQHISVVPSSTPDSSMPMLMTPQLLTDGGVAVAVIIAITFFSKTSMDGLVKLLDALSKFLK